jgi:hypothetical protein
MQLQLRVPGWLLLRRDMHDPRLVYRDMRPMTAVHRGMVVPDQGIEE